MSDYSSSSDRVCVTCGISIAETYALRRYCDAHTPRANTKGKKTCPKCGTLAWSSKRECRACTALKPSCCPECGKAGPRKRCSSCAWKTKTPATCASCGEQKKIMARGICSACYSAAHREDNKRERTCQHCGKAFMHARSEVKVCSLSCSSARAQKSRLASPGWLQYQEQVQANKKPAKPAETTQQREARRRNARGPLLAAYEDQDHEALIGAVRNSSQITPDGCWEWQRQRTKDGYPVVKMAQRTHQVHRLVLEAKERAPLGSQQSHHICANSICVNPDHLQPATYAENIAEMKARNSYIARITELEQALAEIQPEHPVLDRAGYAKV